MLEDKLRRPDMPYIRESDPPAPEIPPPEPAAGDEASPGTPGTGDDICPTCNGSGEVDGETCPECGGTGTVIRGVGGA